MESLVDRLYNIADESVNKRKEALYENNKWLIDRIVNELIVKAETVGTKVSARLIQNTQTGHFKLLEYYATDPVYVVSLDEIFAVKEWFDLEGMKVCFNTGVDMEGILDISLPPR